MEYRKLSECCEFISDGDHLPPPKCEAGVPFITISNIVENRIDFGDTMFVSDAYYDGLSITKRARKGDILYSVVGSFGKPVFIDYEKRFVFQRHIAILRPKKDVNPKYLYYTMLNPYFYQIADKLAIGAAQRTVTLESLRGIKVKIPSINQQNKIVEVLSKIDEKIACNRRINDNLSQQLKLLYDYWFTQFDFPDVNGRPYRLSGGKTVWEPRLHMNIPMDWQVLTLKDVIEHIHTGLNPRNNFTLGNGSIKYITVKNLTTDGMLNFSGCDTIDEEARSKVHNRSEIAVGDILFASIAPLGRCYLITDKPENWDINESVFSIRPNKCISSEYLYSFLTSDRFINGATNSSTGSIFKGIRINTLLQTMILLPSKPILDEFSTIARSMLRQKSAVCRENGELQYQRDWLLPMLMNGQATIAD